MNQTTGKLIALAAGPLACAVVLAVLPTTFENAAGETVDFTWQGRAALGVLCWMAIWWMAEALPLAATALLPIVLFPLLGVFDVKAAVAPYAHPLIFLFLGGFVLALSMQHWGLGERVALLMLRAVGPRPRLMIAGFMLVTAGFSAFVSNTATTAMMLPIALSVIALVQGNNTDDSASAANFAPCLLLGMAYAASIGGVATIIGTPPNGLLIAYVRDQMPPDQRISVGFVEWMRWGLPLAVVFLPITWLLLLRLFPFQVKSLDESQAMLSERLARLGRMKRAESITLAVFVLAAALWVSRPWLTSIVIGSGESTFAPLAGLGDTVIAIGAALLLFLLPHKLRPFEPVMTWQTAAKLPWDILLLFGGGLSLAAAIDQHKVADWFASWGAQLGDVPEWAIVLSITASVVLLTEMTSNMATTAALLPVLAGLAPGLGIHPYLLMFPTAMAASCAFMLPVATPPNAIVFGSGHIELRQMMRAGVWMNCVSVALVVLITYAVLKPILL